MMDVEYRKIVIELNEYDALRLLNLILRKTHQDHQPWRPYWKYLAQKVEQSIEGAGAGSSRAVSEPSPAQVKNSQEQQTTNL
jgi:hypothetical protein